MGVKLICSRPFKGTTDYESEYTERTRRTQMSNGSRGREYTSNDTSAEVTPREKILTSKFSSVSFFFLFNLFLLDSSQELS